EETTFSYPAKILPPSPQNIAKSIIIIPDLKVELNYIDIPLVSTTNNSITDNTDEWFNTNSPVSKNVDIDIKSKLDPTLLINTFNDLKRFYKSVTIYYNYNVNSVSDKHGGGYDTKKSFNPAKELTSSIEINLNDLIFSKSIPNIDKKKHFEKGKIGNHSSGYAYAYYQGNKSQYNLVTYEFTVIAGIESKFNNNNPIGFDILSNSNDNLNWKINIFVTPCKGHVETIIDFGENSYAKIYTNQELASIYKIILNAR
ncbi:MAG: hypothetical protein H9Q67_06900, partial [Spiroplasma ixodetis]|nr:hypothetical protein [Spiroplasma ixodetis]